MIYLSNLFAKEIKNSFPNDALLKFASDEDLFIYSAKGNTKDT